MEHGVFVATLLTLGPEETSWRMVKAARRRRGYRGASVSDGLKSARHGVAGRRRPHGEGYVFEYVRDATALAIAIEDLRSMGLT